MNWASAGPCKQEKKKQNEWRVSLPQYWSTRNCVYLVNCEVNNMRNMIDSRPSVRCSARINGREVRWCGKRTRKMIIDYPIRIAKQYDGRNAPNHVSTVLWMVYLHLSCKTKCSAAIIQLFALFSTDARWHVAERRKKHVCAPTIFRARAVQQGTRRTHTNTYTWVITLNGLSHETNGRKKERNGNLDE